MGIYTVRPAEQSDVAVIAKTALNAWKHTYHSIYPENIIDQFVARAYSTQNLTRSIESDCNRDHRLFHVAVDAYDEVVAFSHTVPEPNNENSFELVRIYALPQTHGTGVGTALINHLFHELTSFAELSAWVEKDNAIGRQFYERHAFQVVSEKEDDFFGYKTQLLKYIFVPNRD